MGIFLNLPYKYNLKFKVWKIHFSKYDIAQFQVMIYIFICVISWVKGLEDEEKTLDIFFLISKKKYY